jgi:hypothetical protein
VGETVVVVVVVAVVWIVVRPLVMVVVLRDVLGVSMQGCGIQCPLPYAESRIGQMKLDVPCLIVPEL